MRRVAVTFVTAVVACGSGRSVPSTGGTLVPSLLLELAPTAKGKSSDLSYDLIDLGEANAYSIDPRGRVTGAWSGPGNPSGSSPSYWTGAVYTPGSGWSAVPIPEGATFVSPIGIDANDRVALNVWFPSPVPVPPNANPYFQRAYLGYPAVPLLAPGETEREGAVRSDVHAMDPSTGHVVGFNDVLGGGFLYDGATMIPVAVQPVPDGQGALAGASSVATALNARDQVVGWMWLPQYGLGKGHAFFWDHGAPVDLGAVGPCHSEATAINRAGLVAGTIELGRNCGDFASFLLEAVFVWDGRTRILGCPEGAVLCSAAAINARGDVVGDALVESIGFRSFILRDGTFHWLDENVVGADGWKFDWTIGINDAGAIAGRGKREGEVHAFLLTPR